MTGAAGLATPQSTHNRSQSYKFGIPQNLANAPLEVGDEVRITGLLSRQKHLNNKIGKIIKKCRGSLNYDVEIKEFQEIVRLRAVFLERPLIMHKAIDPKTLSLGLLL